jgi:hypothetical protein
MLAGSPQEIQWYPIFAPVCFNMITSGNNTILPSEVRANAPAWGTADWRESLWLRSRNSEPFILAMLLGRCHKHSQTVFLIGL